MGVIQMYFMFIVESIRENENRDNQALFKLVTKHNIAEENIFFDTEGKDVVYEMIDKMGLGDTLIVKRVDDLASTNRELKTVLEIMESKKIVIASEEHKGLNGRKYYSSLLAAQDISDFYKEKRRLQGYKEAQERGKVGRPRKKQELEIALRLYRTGQFTISEIEKLSGVSSSTIYRNLKSS